MKIIQFTEEEFLLVGSILARMKEQLILDSALKQPTKEEQQAFKTLQVVCKKFQKAIKKGGR